MNFLVETRYDVFLFNAKGNWRNEPVFNGRVAVVVIARAVASNVDGVLLQASQVRLLHG